MKLSPSTFADAQVMKPSGKQLFLLKKELNNYSTYYYYNKII